MKAIVRRRRAGTESMSNGNGHGYESNGNGSKSIFAIAQLASTGVLILGMFGLWWQSADPKSRLDKIETVQLDNRKELNDTLAALRKDIAERYVSQRELENINRRLQKAEEEEAANHPLSLPKSVFEAWRSENENFVKNELQEFNQIKEDLKNFPQKYITRAEHVDLQQRINRIDDNIVTRAEHNDRWNTEYKVDQEVAHKIDVIQNQLDKLRENTTTNPVGEAMSRRIDQLNENFRLLQTQLFEILHNRAVTPTNGGNSK